MTPAQFIQECRLEHHRHKNQQTIAEQRKAQLLSDLNKWNNTVIPTRRASKSHKKSARLLRKKSSMSMLDMGAPAFHRIQTALGDKRTALLQSKYHNRLKSKGKIAFGR